MISTMVSSLSAAGSSPAAVNHCERSRRQLRIPEHDFDDLDARNGFVADPNREWRAPRRASNHRGPSFPTPPRAVRALTWLRNLAV